MNRKKRSQPITLGVGYITAMLIFAVLGLTVFAVMGFSAAGADDKLNRRRAEYVQQYYQADIKAKEILAELDEIADKSRDSLSFADSFKTASAHIEGIEYKNISEDVCVSYSVPISKNTELSAEIMFYENGDYGYKIKMWQSRTLNGGDNDSGLNVWDGNF